MGGCKPEINPPQAPKKEAPRTSPGTQQDPLTHLTGLYYGVLFKINLYV